MFWGGKVEGAQRVMRRWQYCCKPDDDASKVTRGRPRPRLPPDLGGNTSQSAAPKFSLQFQPKFLQLFLFLPITLNRESRLDISTEGAVGIQLV